MLEHPQKLLLQSDKPMEKEHLLLLSLKKSSRTAMKDECDLHSKPQAYGDLSEKMVRSLSDARR